MIEWLLKLLPVKWSAVAALREQNRLLEMQKQELEKKLAASDTSTKELEAQIANLQQESQTLKDEVQRFSHIKLDDREIEILVALSKYKDLTVDELTDILQISDTQVQYHLNRLASEHYIEAPRWIDTYQVYGLLSKGIDYLVENKLV